MKMPDGFLDRANKGQIFEEDFDHWEYKLQEDWSGYSNIDKIKRIIELVLKCN